MDGVNFIIHETTWASLHVHTWKIQKIHAREMKTFMGLCVLSEKKQEREREKEQFNNNKKLFLYNVTGVVCALHSSREACAILLTRQDGVMGIARCGGN